MTDPDDLAGLVESREYAIRAATILADRLAVVEAERDRARSLACQLLGLFDWRTPSFLRNPERAEYALRHGGIAVYDPNPLRDVDQLEFPLDPD